MSKKVDKAVAFFSNLNYLSSNVNVNLRTAIVREILCEINGERIIDIGCGDGSVSLPYSNLNKLTLLDATDEMLIAAKKQMIFYCDKDREPSFVKADFMSYSFEAKYDVIICLGLFSHIEDPELMLRKIKTILSKSGRLLIQISDIDHRLYRRRNIGESEYGYSLNKVNKTDFLSLVKRLGYGVRGEHGYPLSTFPITLFPKTFQYNIRNRIRKSNIFKPFNSEYIFELVIEDV